MMILETKLPTGERFGFSDEDTVELRIRRCCSLLRLSSVTVRVFVGPHCVGTFRRVEVKKNGRFRVRFGDLLPHDPEATLRFRVSVPCNHSCREHTAMLAHIPADIQGMINSFHSPITLESWGCLDSSPPWSLSPSADSPSDVRWSTFSALLGQGDWAQRTAGSLPVPWCY